MGKFKIYSEVDWNSLVVYDESSPTCLRWKVDCCSGRWRKIKHIKVGDVAGSLNPSEGYSQIHYNRTMWRVSRIVWEMFNGPMPEGCIIDHKDGNPENNKKENLRAILYERNSRNKKMQHNNTSGFVGVTKLKFTNPAGKDYWYYKAEWNRLNGQKEYKIFSVHRLGETDAFHLACEYRAKMIAELNEQGAGYTDRHGT